jgi:hypothetical protein
VVDLPNFTRAQREVIDELWGMGFTVGPLDELGGGFNPDSGYSVSRIPVGMFYQWNATDDELSGWKPVPCSRYPGRYAPYFSVDNIKYAGLYLMERPALEVTAEYAASNAKARQNVTDWMQRQGAAGFSGSVTVLSEGSVSRSAEVTDIDRATASTKIPPELYDHLPELIRERDRLVKEAHETGFSAEAFDQVGLRVSCLQTAIDTLRQKYALPLIREYERVFESMDGIPADMLDRNAEIFVERDRLWEEASSWWGKITPEFAKYEQIARENPEWPRGKIMNAVLIPIAVANVRRQKDQSHG